MPPPLLDLAAWVADHYLAPPGECYRLVLPPAGVRASRAVVRLAASRDAAGDPVLRRAARRARCGCPTLATRLGRDPASRLARLRARRASWRWSRTLERAGLPAACGSRRSSTERPRRRAARRRPRSLRAAARGRRPRARRRPPARPPVAARRRWTAWPSSGVVRDRGGARTPAGRAPPRQRARAVTVRHRGPGARRSATLLRRRSTRGRFRPFLLHGVTGSGKTEVYFRAAERGARAGPRRAAARARDRAHAAARARGRARASARPSRVLHSELSAGERHDQWWRIREGEARVVVGARSAVFAPVPDARADRRGRGARGGLQAGGEPALPRAATWR